MAPVRAARRRGRLRRLGIVAAGVVLALLLAFAALWQLTPGVQDAQVRVRAAERAHGAPSLPSLPREDKVARALVATEDSRFWTSPGVDPQSVVRAGLATVTGSSDVGGATLEQQLAKLLYPPAGTGFNTKVKQAALAVKLNLAYSKQQILDMYAEVAYYGHGFYGLEQASCGYFGHPAQDLTVVQGAMLAGVVNAPSVDDPINAPANARARLEHVIDRMVAVGYLTKDQGQRALRTPLGLTGGYSSNC